MKTRFRKKAWLCAVLFLALVLPQMNMFARGFIDQTEKCTLTVTKDVFDKNVEGWADLADTDKELEVYLYQIATLDQYGRYTVAKEFKDAAGSNYPNAETWDIEELNNGVYEVSADDWRKEARYIAGILDLPIPPAADAGEEEEGKEESEEQTPDEEEFVIPEEEKLTSTPCFYKKVNTNEEIEVENGLYLVWAKPFATGEYEYTFLPYLVSVPDYAYGRQDDENAELDDWIYHVTVGLKPKRQVRYLDLEIVKSLFTYNESLSGDNEDSSTNTPILGGAMFVFQVDAVKRETGADGTESTKVVYSNVLGMNFKEPGQQRILVKKIPAGSEVTVKEIYTGASYKLTGWGGETWNPESEVFTGEADNPTVVIEKLLGSSRDVNGGYDDEGIEIAAKVTFTNDYDETTTFGSGIINHFTYSEDTRKWVGVQIKDGTSGGGSSR